MNSRKNSPHHPDSARQARGEGVATSPGVVTPKVRPITSTDVQKLGESHRELLTLLERAAVCIKAVPIKLDPALYPATLLRDIEHAAFKAKRVAL